MDVTAKDEKETCKRVGESGRMDKSVGQDAVEKEDASKREEEKTKTKKKVVGGGRDEERHTQNGTIIVVVVAVGHNIHDSYELRNRGFTKAAEIGDKRDNS